MAEWIEVDRAGLAKQLSRKGKAWVLYELIQNGLDEDGVTQVDVKLDPAPDHRGYVRVTVEDNAPEGFKDLKHSWLLFGESPKKGDATKRGRFDAGEKFVLSLCKEAKIESVTGTVVFNDAGRKLSKRKVREAGTAVELLLRCTQQEAKEALEACKGLIVPPGITLTLNGNKISHRKETSSFEAPLPTVLSDEEGNLKRTVRKTKVDLYEVKEGEEATIFEMGIPICTTGGDDNYHYDVGQKVPLGLDRDSVTPAYLRTLRVSATNELYETLNHESASSGWVREAASDERIIEAAYTKVQDERFGKKRVNFDPSDPEANKIAMAKGYTIVYGGSQSSGEHANNKRFGTTQSAGKVTPSPKPYDENGTPLVTRSAKSEDEKRFERFAQDLGSLLIEREPQVRFATDVTWPVAATFGPGSDLVVNVGRLGKKFFRQINSSVVELLLHEYSHENVSDHLSYKFADEIAKLGARLSIHLATNPESKLKEYFN